MKGLHEEEYYTEVGLEGPLVKYLREVLEGKRAKKQKIATKTVEAKIGWDKYCRSTHK